MNPNLNEEAAAVAVVWLLDKLGRKGHASSPSIAARMVYDSQGGLTRD
jgi:hypothetical protein